jgi:hypothetical protein
MRSSPTVNVRTLISRPRGANANRRPAAPLNGIVGLADAEM